MLPHVLEYSAPACIERLAELARVSGLEQGGETDEALAGKFIKRVGELKQDLHEFTCVAHAQLLTTQWRWQYNNGWPNSAIGGVPPARLLQ